MLPEDRFLAPLNIICYGRSGSSLLSQILATHPEIDFVGETAQIIFWTWLGAEQSYFVTRRNIDQEREFDENDICGEAVRAVLRGLFPSQKRIMLQKPIGIPEAFWYQKLKKVDCGAWYWRVLTSSFPSSKYMTIIRNPLDVAVSAAIYWNQTVESVVVQLGEMAKLLLHPGSLVEFAVSYDNLIADPTGELSRICEKLSLEFCPEMLGALGERHVALPEGANFVRPVNELREVISTEIGRDALADVARLWERFGFDPTDFEGKSKYFRLG